MEPEGSLPYSKLPTTYRYPKPVQTSPFLPHLTSWKSFLILSSHLRLGLPSGFPTKTLYTHLAPIRATCPAHPIIHELITRTILREQYRSLNSSLCSVHHSPVTTEIYYIVISVACYLFRAPIVAIFRKVFFEGCITWTSKTVHTYKMSIFE